VEHPAWPGGVLGIAAARLMERYHKPAIVLATPPGKPAHGSARSVEALNITAALASHSDLLLNFGGHPRAAGFALAEENIPIFRRRMVKTVKEMMSSAGEMESTISIDSWLTLADISFDLAAALETVSPYGPGNPQLILASSKLMLEDTIPLGRNKEHRKLKVKDQAGNSQEVLWWNGGDEDLPEGVFDLAYTLRQSDWRGSPQLQLEFIDFKIAESDNLTIKGEWPIVVDYRREKEPDRLLSGAKNQPSIIIWAEGQEKSRVSGTDRFGLIPADLLIIWTIPPSPEDLALALDKVHPKTIWLVGYHRPFDDFESFILTLTGMIKYALSREEGRISYTRLAAATGQRLETVRYGVDWLEARGIIGFESEKKGIITVRKGSSANKSKLATQIQINIQSLLAETAEYRSYFAKATKDSLFP
jgi:single-stranded-DNA-specific exonuclease